MRKQMNMFQTKEQDQISEGGETANKIEISDRIQSNCHKMNTDLGEQLRNTVKISRKKLEKNFKRTNQSQRIQKGKVENQLEGNQ